MTRFAGLLLLGGLLVAAANPVPLAAQSKAKKTGPVVTLDNLKSQTFDYWKQEKSPPKPAVYQFVIPETLKSTRDESGILTITPVTSDEKTLFGELKQMMVPPEGKKIDDAVKLTKVKTGAGEVTQMYFFGTIREGISSAAKTKEKQRVLALVLPSKEKKYLITLIGPSRAIGGSQGNFIDWVKSFK